MYVIINTVEPLHINGKMFFLIDYVRLIKNIPNHWITKSCGNYISTLMGKTATWVPWVDIKVYINFETNQLVKLSKFSEVSL